MSPEISALSFRDLGYVVALGRDPHFRRAAEACFVAQPTLSAQVAKVEKVLGVKLFDRSNRSVRVTDVGRRIIEQATLVLNEAEKIPTLVNIRQPLEGPLSVGVLATIGPYLLPYVLPELEAHYPELKLYIVEGTTDELAAELRKGGIDLLIASPSPLLEEFCELSAFFEPFFLCANANERIARRKRLQLHDLEDMKMLQMGPGHCFADQAFGFCATGGATAESFQAASLETLRLLVAAGRGSALMPKLAVDGSVMGPSRMLSYIPFREKDVGRDITLYHRKSSPFGSDAEILAKLIAGAVK